MEKKHNKRTFKTLLKTSVVSLILLLLAIFSEQMHGTFMLSNQENTATAEEQSKDQELVTNKTEATFADDKDTGSIISEMDKTARITGMKPNENKTGLIIPETAEKQSKDQALGTNKTEATLTNGEYTFSIISEIDKTACITGMKPNKNKTGLIIPKTVSNNGTAYKVTAINFDNKTKQYKKVKSITIPASVTGKVLITSTDLQGTLPKEAKLKAHPYCVPFPNLKKVIFLGKTAPKSIEIFSYLSYNDMIYWVPSGSEAAYVAVSKPSLQQPVMRFYDFDDICPYKEYSVAPVIVSDTLTSPEPHLFQTNNGVYLVTKSAADGKGTVALIKCKKLISKYKFVTPDSVNFVYPKWDDYTIETKAVTGSYQYTVTALQTGALLDFRNITMLTIPDTITKMYPNCIYAGDYLNYVFFSKNCKTITGNIFNSGENGAQNGLLFYVPSAVTKLDGDYSHNKINQIYLPYVINASKNWYKACSEIVYYNKSSVDALDNVIKVSSNRVTVSIGSTKKITASNSNTKLFDILHYISMDPGVASVSDKGVITPKHKGTAYLLVFSEVTGAHQLIQVSVKDTTFTEGIFTYRIDYSSTSEVTVISCKPTKSMKTLTIPSSVQYNGKKYSVTQVCAGDYIIDQYNWHAYTAKAGFPRLYDWEKPLISATNAKNCSITEVVFPSTIKRTVANIGNLTKMKKIVYKGTKAPICIAMSEQNIKKATVYVSAKGLSTYKKTVWKWKEGDNEISSNGYLKESKIKLITY